MDPLSQADQDPKRAEKAVTLAKPEGDEAPDAGALPEEDPFIGRVLGGLYRIEELIGEGGMGAVYAATHVHLNRQFAVKILSELVASNDTAVARLLQEAQAASSIEHDNIIDVVSFDSTEDGRVFIVMEMLKGESLGDLMELGPMSLEVALPIAYQVCDAVSAAHKAGIVHRDLKPENIFLTEKYNATFVKVLDFGISKVHRAEQDKVRMTQTGQLVGTPLYMSPEQARGEMEIDHRTDVYSFGIMLYEMLAAEPPFSGGNAFQLLWKHGNEAPRPLDEVLPSVPKALSDVIMKSLAKSPDQRQQSMAELMEALANASGVAPRRSVPSYDSLSPARPATTEFAPIEDLAKSEAPSDAPPPADSAASSRRVILIGLALALAGAFLVWKVLSGDPEGGELRAGELAEDAAAHALANDPPSLDEQTEPEQDPSHDESTAIPLGEDPSESVVPMTIHIESEPPGAEVSIGGEVIGETPLDYEASLGDEFEVRLTRRGYVSQSIEVTADESKTVPVRLRRHPRSGSSGVSGSSAIRGEL